MGRSRSTKTNMHPFKEGAIDINRGGYGSLIGKINLKMLEQTSKNHPVREIPTRNHQVIGKHDIDDETRDIHFNASQKALNEKGCTTTSMTIPLI